MEDKRINEKESIELISEMIQKTKVDATMRKDYDEFLFYGYTATAVSIITWLSIHFTSNEKFMFIWFAMFIPYLWSSFFIKHPQQHVLTYLDSMLRNVWKVIGSMFGLTIIALTIIGYVLGTIDFSLMMPLSIIYAGIGTSMTGLIIKEKWFIWSPLIGLLAAVYMLTNGICNNFWNLLFGVSFLVFMVIPAHIVRNKIK